jgi:glycosyltransferase involved in cell wall biosynthesis
MTFSIIITSYNSESYIERAIQCALAQTRKPDEILICDDNSADRTIEICEKYQDVVTIVVNPKGPSGLCNAFNFALQQSKTDYLSVLHYDDLLSEHFLHNVEKAFTSHPECKFLYAGCDYIDNDDNVVLPYYQPSSLTPVLYSGVDYATSYLNGVKTNKHLHRCPGVVFHRELISSGLRFRQEPGIILDDDLFYRVGNFTKVLGINYPLAHVRHHEASETGSMKLLSITYELSKDYLFLIQDWNPHSLIGEKGLIQFYYFAYQNIFRTIYYAVLARNTTITAEVLDYYNIIRKLHPNAFSSNKKITYQILIHLATANQISFLRFLFRTHRFLRKTIHRSL